MKRSEMLKLIDDDIQDILLTYDMVDGKIDNKFFNNHADLILKTVENAGMLPPSRELNNGHTLSYRWEPEE